MRAVLTFVAIFLVLVGLAGGLVWFIVASGPKPLASEAALFEARNRGLAELENGRFAEAIAEFEVIVADAPDEPVGGQNLTVAGLSLMQDGAADPAAFDLGRQAALDGLDQLDRLPVERSLRLRLLGRFHRLDGDARKAVGALSEAAHEAADDPDLWYEAYAAGRDADDATAPSYLQTARSLNPSNLFLIAESLPQVDRESEAFGELVEWATRSLQPLREEIRSQSGIDVIDRLQTAAADADTAPRALREVANVIRPQSLTQADRLRVDRNLLEFVRTDFSDAFYARYRPEKPPVPTEATFPFDLDSPQSLPIAIDGLTLVDFDLDGREEFAAIDGDRLVVQAVDGTELAAVDVGAFDAATIIAVDIDNDFDRARPVNPAAGESPCRTADLDFIVWSAERIGVVRNDLSNNSNDERTLGAITEVERPGDTAIASVAVADVEADGDLDLLVLAGGELSVLINDGTGAFSPSDRLVVQPRRPLDVLDSHAVDLDGDFDLDLVVLRRGAVPLGFFENVRRGILRWRVIKEVSLGPGVQPEAMAVFEGTGDGVWDIAVLADGDSVFTAGRSSQPGRWSASTPVKIGRLQPLGRGPLALDLNRDGWVELLAATIDKPSGERRLATRGDFINKRTFVQTLDRMPPAALVGLTGGVVPGQTHLVAIGEDGPVAYPAVRSEQGDAVEVTLLAEQVKDDQGQPSGRVNAYGIGTTLQLRAGERTITRQVTGPTTTLGLGDRETAESLRILWTNGIPSHVIGPQAGEYVCEEQKLKGSCPYAYGWTGERFEFITDLLWAAPIGLTDAGGKLMQPRPWEHLLVRGDQLRPRQTPDGPRYELRLTEELWEAAYFDRVTLTAVDHPPGVEVFSNEKVGPPSVAQPLLHRVTERIVPVRADVDGRDVTGLLASEDDRYARAYTVKRMQGLVESSSLTLTFDRVPDGPATLFLTGWLRPTDTSLNVAIAQNASLDPPQPPALSVPDGDGWQVVQPFFGFPGGKTKTIAVDVTGLLDPADPRLRLTSSQELAYDAVWLSPRDAIAFDGPVDRDDLIVGSCELLAADLRTRGVSAMHRHAHYGPERFDYAEVQPSPWRPMRGRFTRLGPVAELLADEDDRLVVIGSGDEIALSLRVPPLREGWVRDFVLTSVGYDKDADLNTVLGDSSEPYPLRDQPYPGYQPLEERADAKFQTRAFRPSSRAPLRFSEP